MREKNERITFNNKNVTDFRHEQFSVGRDEVIPLGQYEVLYSAAREKRRKNSGSGEIMHIHQTF